MTDQTSDHRIARVTKRALPQLSFGRTQNKVCVDVPHFDVLRFSIAFLGNSFWQQTLGRFAVFANFE